MLGSTFPALTYNRQSPQRKALPGNRTSDLIAVRHERLGQRNVKNKTIKMFFPLMSFFNSI